VTPKLSVVVPCFNEGRVLKEFHRRMVSACRAVAPGSYEIVFVDDGSEDDSFAIMHELSREPGTLIVKLMRNFGHQAAVTAGISIACGERVLLIDADLQDPPELLPDMMRLMDGGADVVYGRRTRREGETTFKILTAHLFYRLLSRLSGTPIPQDTGDFRLMQRRIVDLLATMPERQRFIRGMVSWIGGIQVPLDYVRSPRKAGDTKYYLTKMMSFAGDAITSFSLKPLRGAIWMALIVGALALVLLAYTLAQWIEGRTIFGWTSLMTAICVFASMQFLLLGLIGEYLGRVFIEAKQRPLFLVDTIVSGDLSIQPPLQLGTLKPAEWHELLAQLRGPLHIGHPDVAEVDRA
jgi:glycosyltransferase involved in cell wall biosynthesis